MTLNIIIERLAECICPITAPYFVPGLWIDARTGAAQSVNPYQFYHRRLTEIAAAEPQTVISGAPGGGWSKNAIVYNLFPRLTTAFDHAADGHLDIVPGADGWRETGTLLKCIAVLPYLKSMNFNTIHLLPITTVGQDGKKGDLGSPYAIRNPYRLDERLAEPALDLSAEVLFAGFMEAAHRLGFRVVMEFVLRTASKDSDVIQDHPDWFYWIRATIPDRATGTSDPTAYGNPLFPQDQLRLVKARVDANDFHDLPPPPAAYQQMFTLPPRADAVQMVNGRWIGTLDDGTQVRVPGAFSDWPPDDNQPPWGDVTYLRLYNHPDFNYIAYNTIRMYDERSAQPEFRNEALWTFIEGIIPYYQRQFSIDGVMIDMGHAMPMPLKQRVIGTARAHNPDFAFWDENFGISWHSRSEGYNAVMGYLMFDLHTPGKVHDFVRRMAHETLPLGYFGAPENHNTPRAAARPGGTDYARYGLSLCATFTGMPFVLTGFELGETQPINTGLGFSDEQLARYPAERLPLFSAAAFDWTRPDNLVEAVRTILGIRVRFSALFTDGDPATVSFGHSDNPAILVFVRRCGDTHISVIANTDVLNPQHGRVVIGGQARTASALLGVTGTIPLSEELSVSVSLAPSQVIMLEHEKGS